MALVGIIMGSTSDWETMRHAAETLDALDVAYETKVVSAHRTPQRLYDYATTAADRGLKVVIAGAGDHHLEAAIGGGGRVVVEALRG
ncbi:MAG: AIR carboxylase family protein, partial [Alphaproteobacteria bacterium]